MYSIFVTKKEEDVCGNCKHFYQHYVKSESGFSKCYVGHCSYPRIKCKEETDSCKYFIRKLR